jgi:hypothetical protein
MFPYIAPPPQGDVVEYELPLMPVREGPGLLELNYTYEDVIA